MGQHFTMGKQKKIERRDKDNATNLVLDTISEGGQCLVFESSRRNCTGFAKTSSNKVVKLLDREVLDLRKGLRLCFCQLSHDFGLQKMELPQTL